jgi:hypothetical protein
MRRFTLLVLFITLAQGALLAQVKNPWYHFHVKYVRPSEAMDSLMRKTLKLLPEGVPEPTGPDIALPNGVDRVLAYDVDNTVIVRATPEGMVAIGKILDKVDVPPPHVRMKLRLMPVMRDLPKLVTSKGKGTVSADIARLMETTEQTVETKTNWVHVRDGQILQPLRAVPDQKDCSCRISLSLDSYGAIKFLCGLDYDNVPDDVNPAGSNQITRRSSQLSVTRLYFAAKGEKATFAFPVDDPKFPVEYFLLEITPEVIPPSTPFVQTPHVAELRKIIPITTKGP